METRKIFSGYKVLAHLDKILEWIEGKNQSLVVFEIDLTNRCNNKCPKCIGGRVSADAFLSLEEIESVIGQAVELGAKGVIFTGGGEPLLSKHFEKAVLFSRAKGLDVVVLSNGLALTRENAKVILENCVGFRVSLDAGNSEMYKITHGMEKQHFQKVVSNLKILQRLREERKYLCDVGIGYLTGVKTVEYGEMEDFVKIGIACGLDYVQFRPFHFDFTSIDELKKLRNEYGRRISIQASEQKYDYFREPEREYQICHGANFQTVIAADANVYICCHHRGNKKYSLGSLRSETIEKIWERRKSVIDRVDFNDCIPLCRCDEINCILEKVKKGRENRHRNFL